MRLPPILLWLFPMWRLLVPSSAQTQHGPCSLVQRTALCNRSNLTAVPDGLPHNVVALHLNYNTIQTLQHTSLSQYPSLNTLSLACNFLAKVDSNTFLNSALLANLNLAKNNLDRGYHETGTALTKLSMLTALDLSENKLDDEMVSHLLKNLSALEYLNLSGNLLKRLDETSFSDLHQLRDLSLEGNLLFEIDNAFEGNPNLQRLNLAYNYLPCLTDFHMSQLLTLNASHNVIEWFMSREDQNQSFELETLDLSHNQLVFFPFLPSRSRLRNLYLSYNVIRFYEGLNQNSTPTVEFYNMRRNMSNVTAVLWDDSVHGDISSIETLDLRANQLEYFPRGFIQKMPFLSKLQMSTNCLETLNLTSERFSSSLYELDLSNNRLRNISADEGTLSNLNNLTYFNLSHNNLEILPVGFFSSLPSIRSVDLSYNSVNVCRSEDEVRGTRSSTCLEWRNIVSLRQLRLRGCNLQRIPSSVLAGLSLTHLDLSDNPELIVQQLIQRLSGTLQHLGLGNTHMQNVDFSYFRCLNSLDISRNSLTHLPTSLLNLDLKVLDLRDNRLATIPPSQAHIIAPKLQTVYLTGNPFNCCQTEWFRTFETMKNIHMVGRLDMECEDLLQVTHRVMRSQSFMCFHEGGEGSLLWLILIAASACVFILTISGLVFVKLNHHIIQKPIQKKYFKPSSY
ncbi:transforming growth factor beta activator LRRC33 [Gouania willdenowi]|uniref:Negative regulator of reactive oxygen species n=1 Tax=Gouania willdenowi TaxID=441366 RepID=A0A8C5HCZ8_GOUWI|nr:transforming growth factor beta activator LRRC33 [Gouania willdenowi]XP_028290193.1 transforming growth factor beta activator LRRC33 [Gouania willdenowi]